MSIRPCLLLGLCAPCAAALAWACDATGPVLGDAPAQSDRDAGADAWCTGDLSNIGTGDFHVACTVTSAQTGRVALANQRSWCFYQVMWDLRMEAGVPVIELDDDAGVNHYTKLWGGVGHPMDDGQPHDLLVERVSGTLSITVDSVRTASTAATESIGPLPPLVAGSDICDGVDGTLVLTPPLQNLCVGKQ